MFFIPQLISHARGEGLINQYYDLPLEYQDNKSGRHVWHGFFYQSLTSFLMPTGTYEWWLNINRLYDFLSLGCLTVYLFLARRIAPSLPLICFSLSVMVAVPGYLLGLQGRPELLSFMLVSLLVLTSHHGNFFLKAAIAGLIIGFVAMTSPIQGIVTGLCILTYLVAHERPDFRLLLGIVLLVCCCALAISVAISLYPYTIRELLAGISEHRQVLRTLGYQTLDPFGHLRSVTMYTGRFMMVLPFACGVFAALFLVLRCDRSFSCRLTSVILVLITSGVVCFYHVASGWYVIVGALPILIALSTSLLASNRSKLAQLIVVMSFAICAVDPLLHVASRFTHGRGMSLKEARTQLAGDLGGGKITDAAFSITGFMLTDSQTGNDTLIWQQYMNSGVESQKRWLVVVQGYAEEKPRDFDNYQMRINRYVAQQNNWLPQRLRQWFFPAGFQYAVYERL